MVKNIRHLDEEQIIEAVVDEKGLDGALRRHLLQCPSCRARKEDLQGRLARFGQISREGIPADFRKPRLSRHRAGVSKWTWELRPALGMSIAFASLLALLITPLTLNRDTTIYTLDRVFQEMRQDGEFLSEIEKLEDNPLPHIYVEISDPGDDEKDIQSPKSSQPPDATRNDSMTPDGGSRNA
jgi:hypothetical protein